MPTNNTASDEETKTEDDVRVDNNNNNIRTDEVNEDNQVPQLMNGAHVNDMYTQFPVQCEYCMRTFGDDFRRPPMHESQRSEEHTSELQSRGHLVCRLLLEKKNKY